MTLLITAFGHFDGGPNCSETLLEALQAEQAELEAIWRGPVAFVLLPVDTEAIETAFRAAVAKTRPTHVLLTGQAGGRDAISLESLARNRRDLAIPDDSGRLGACGPVRENGPWERPATWPGLETIAQAIAQGGSPARLSVDAGTHLCNQTLYLAAEIGPESDPPFVATFLHLPLLPEQVAAHVPAAVRHQNCFAMPLDDMVRATKIVLRHTVEAGPTGN